MNRILLMLVLLAAAGLVSVAQEQDSDADAEQVEAPAGDDADDGNAEEAPIDDEYYQDIDDEDFRPSEDIPADQSIPFPTDI